MRVTNGMLVTNMMKYMSNNMAGLERLQTQLATGKRIRLPSDDPIATSTALKIRTDLAQNERYTQNAQSAISWLSTTESALRDLGSVLERVRELVLEGANDTWSEDDKKKIADEMQELQGYVMQLGNATYAGRYIFSGYKTNQPAFVITPGDTIVYQGDDGNVDFEIGVGTYITVNVHGGQGGVEIDGIYNLLGRIAGSLKGQDTTDIDDYIPQIDGHVDNVLALRSSAGAKTNRFELLIGRMGDEKLNFTELLSKNEDADMAMVIIGLKEAENVYRASLAAGGRIIMPTLVDFLR